MEEKFKKVYEGKRILVTGACGTVGREIVEQLLRLEPAEVRVVDNNESEMFFLMENHKQDELCCFLGDVRDRDKITQLSKNIDIIIHCAAFKHVHLSEYNPSDVVQTNIGGVENIIRAASSSRVKRVLFTSSDKAVNPTNVMGTSKLMGEKLMTAANAVKTDSDTVFSSNRFGNVIGSRGSVVPLFMRQIKAGGPVTITDKEMTRFIMTIEDAANLVLESLTIMRGGEVFVTKMPVAKIIDLAEIMIELLAPKYGFDPSDIEKKIVGAKPGEKFYEELLSQEEINRSMELKDMFVITPAFKSMYHTLSHEYPETVSDQVDRCYVSSSEDALSKEELKNYLIEKKVFERVEEGLHGGGV